MSYLKIKDTKKDLSAKNALETSIFNRTDHLLLNDYHTFLTKKVERLTSALYVITGFLRPEEPVRNKLRSCALELVEQASRPTALSEESIELFRARCSEIITILQAARSAQLISNMNANLLSEEYASLATFVKDNIQEIRKVSKEDLYIGHINTEKGQKVYSPKELHKTSKKHYKGQNNNSKITSKTDRRNIIIDLLNKKDRISIKDAVSSIDNCSEKTIQRELLALVQEGILIKEGDRRWSTYRKASPPVSEEVKYP